MSEDEDLEKKKKVGRRNFRKKIGKGEIEIEDEKIEIVEEEKERGKIKGELNLRLVMKLDKRINEKWERSVLKIFWKIVIEDGNDDENEIR